VARSSAGDLTEEEVEGIRTGRIPDPSVRQVSALADVFDIASSWFLDREEERPALLDEQGLEALRDEVAGANSGRSSGSRSAREASCWGSCGSSGSSGMSPEAVNTSQASPGSTIPS
jgi:hypothetical protein